MEGRRIEWDSLSVKYSYSLRNVKLLQMILAQLHSCMTKNASIPQVWVYNIVQIKYKTQRYNTTHFTGADIIFRLITNY